MVYQDRIKAVLTEHAQGYIDARYVEAWMRVAHNGVLDGLSPNGFKSAVERAVHRIQSTPIELSVQLAQSYGLVAR